MYQVLRQTFNEDGGTVCVSTPSLLRAIISEEKEIEYATNYDYHLYVVEEAYRFKIVEQCKTFYILAVAEYGTFGGSQYIPAGWIPNNLLFNEKVHVSDALKIKLLYEYEEFWDVL